MDSWQSQLSEITAEMAYPPTPDIVGGVRRQLAAKKQPLAPKRPPAVGSWFANRLAWIVAAVFLAVGLLLAVPQARAAIINFFQIGSIRLFPDAPAVPPARQTTTAGAAIEPPNSPSNPLLNLAGQTSLTGLESELGPALLLPTYPAGIGLPDEQFFQDQFGDLGIQVWFDSADPEQVFAVVYTLILNNEALAVKSHFQADRSVETAVNGQIAYWLEAQHRLDFYNEQGQIQPELTRLVEGYTLLWTVGEVTYRLETTLTMEEAVRMAESMK